MPPRSLLVDGAVIHDLAGASLAEIDSYISQLNASLPPSTALRLVQPCSLATPLAAAASGGLTPHSYYWPHLGTEDISLSALLSAPFYALSLCEYAVGR